MIPADIKSKILSPIDLLNTFGYTPAAPGPAVRQPTKVQEPLTEKITEKATEGGQMTPDAIRKLIALRQSGVKEKPSVKESTSVKEQSSSSELSPEKIQAIRDAIAGNQIKSVQNIDPDSPLLDDCNGLGGAPTRTV